MLGCNYFHFFFIFLHFSAHLALIPLNPLLPQSNGIVVFILSIRVVSDFWLVSGWFLSGLVQDWFTFYSGLFDVGTGEGSCSDNEE